jgi:GT2 family glycosyltransferase
VASVRAQHPTAIYVVSEVKHRHVEAQHVVTKRGHGFATRANLGLLQARADGHDRALLLNDDTELRDNSLSALAACKSPVCGAVLEHWTGGVQQAGLRVSLRTARVVARTSISTDGSVDAIGGAALCLDLALFDRLGGFDERFHFYFEDVDFCLRARAAGANITLVPGARIRHHGGGTRSHSSPEAAFHLGRSHALLARGLSGHGTWLRLVTVASAGSAWTLRKVGLSGIREFARGFAEGLSTPAA